MDNTNITNWVRYSITFRIIVVGILALLLLIPLGMVTDLIQERKSTKINAVTEISQKWGEQQTVAGPILSVPYKKYITNDKDQRVEITQYAHFLPDTLSINSSVEPQIRSRGIFDAVVYSSEMRFSGKFKKVDMSKLGIEEAHVDWNNAFVSVGISDTRGIEDAIVLHWGDSEIEFKPGVKTNDVIRKITKHNNYSIDPYYGSNNYQDYKMRDSVAQKSNASTGAEQASGVSTTLPENARNVRNSDYEFSFTLNLDGSQDLQFVPAGRTTEISLKSNWSAPSFNGAFLPDERTVSDDGFQASWKIIDLNRGYPQAWLGDAHDVYQSSSGVKLLAGIDDYKKSERSAKYALLIIVLTFMVFFFAEVFNKKKIHPIQYLLVGLAIVLFYTLLIAISEVFNFGVAYLISSIATIGLITLYSKSVLDNVKIAQIQALILAFLYLFVYIILQLEDYALLIGSILLFLILSTVMYLSRKIDWYVTANTDLDNTDY